MNYKDKISLIESIELEGIRYLFENPKSYYFEQDVTIEKNTDGYYIELSFLVTGRNTRSNMIVDDVTIKDIKIWLNDDEKAKITDSDVVKIAKIIKTKMKEL